MTKEEFKSKCFECASEQAKENSKKLEDSMICLALMMETTSFIQRLCNKLYPDDKTDAQC